jgi:DNA-binding protein HU-beta
MKMSLKQLASELTEELGGMTKAEAEAFIKAVFECIAENMEAGHEVNIPAFGKFRVKAKPEREARNPRTGETMTVLAKTVPNVLLAKALKERVNV